MASNDGEKVQLYVYDLSNGLARQLSPMLLHKQIDGIWHTAIVVGGLEYYYGGGVNQSRPGSTPFGRPLQVIDLGFTQIPKEVRDEYLRDMRKIYTPEAYSLFHNNCNNFTNDFSNFLTGSGIPAHITGLPAEVLATPLGQMLAPMLAPLEQQLGNIHQQPAGSDTAPTSQTLASSSQRAATPSTTQAQKPASAAAAAAAPAGLPQLPARPPAAKAAAQAAAKRAATASIEASGNDTGSKQETGAAAVNNGPAIKQAAEEIKDAAGLVMADAGVPQTSGHANGAHTSGQSNGQIPKQGNGKGQAQSTMPAAKPQTGSNVIPSSRDVGLKAAIEAEYGRLMAKGGMSANEAALTAVKNVSVQHAGAHA